jgi:hypothetical protein
MLTKAKESRRPANVEVGKGVELSIDNTRQVLTIFCPDNCVTVEISLDRAMVADYADRSYGLALATWMVVKIWCTPEETAELCAIIGDRMLPDLVHTQM